MIKTKQPEFSLSITGLRICLVFAVIVSSTAMSFTRNAVWKDSVLLWQDTVRKSPFKPRTRSELGIAYEMNNLLDAALLEYRIALDFAPDDAAAHNNMGIVYRRLGHTDEALKEYLIAINLNPTLAETYNNIGNIFQKQGRLYDALAAYQNALQLQPDFEKARNNIDILKGEMRNTVKYKDVP